MCGLGALYYAITKLDPGSTADILMPLMPANAMPLLNGGLSVEELILAAEYLGYKGYIAAYADNGHSLEQVAVYTNDPSSDNALVLVSTVMQNG